MPARRQENSSAFNNLSHLLGSQSSESDASACGPQMVTALEVSGYGCYGVTLLRGVAD